MGRTCGLLSAAVCLVLGVPRSRADICSGISGNLVVNCGFEAGNFTGWTLSGNDVPGQQWKLYGVEGIDPFDSISPNSGSDQAFFADLSANATTLSQTIGTVGGDTYTVSWYLAQQTPGGSGYSDFFTPQFALGGIGISVPDEGYTHYSFLANATSSSTVLSFTLGNDLGRFQLDDISVVAVAAPAPEPEGWPVIGLGVALGALGRNRCRSRTTFSQTPAAASSRARKPAALGATSTV